MRGIGPSLGRFGVPDFLADPALELRNGSGALLMQNNNWEDDFFQSAQLVAIGLGLTNPNESGLVTMLERGGYTAILAGKDEGTGIGLVEIYNVH